MSLTLQKRMKDARALITTFASRNVGVHDCLPEARKRLDALGFAIDAALAHASGNEIQLIDAAAVERIRQELQQVCMNCGPRTQGLVEDIARIFNARRAGEPPTE